jgi:hypothetical protein
VLEDDEDDVEVGEDEAPHAAPNDIHKFKGTAVGSVLAAGMLGLRDVFEPVTEDRPAVVVDWAGEPPFTDPMVLRLDPDHPEDSIVMVRPWLRDGVGPAPTSMPPHEPPASARPTSTQANSTPANSTRRDDELPGDGAAVEDVEPHRDPQTGSGGDA